MGYTAIVLAKESRDLLIKNTPLDDGWTYIAHHMTVNMGGHSSGPMADVPLGTVLDLTVTRCGGIPDRVVAVSVNGNFKSKNETPHITCGVNRSVGAKPVESNSIEKWHDGIPALKLQGTLEEVH